MTHQIIDPDDAILRESVSYFLENSEAPSASTYDFERIDLNEDGRRDALILFKTPYGYWCGTHGCTMLILRAHNNHFSLVNDIQPIREPVYISPAKSHGWKNLLVRVSGRWDKAKNVVMAYNGEKYPNDPSNLPPFDQYNDDEYVRALYN
ncbi:MAG TPA: hypothetical protein PK513_09470 [Alphaproteobacteria bacterium]|nr:hypothetical protein [Alphaproteobacteria bacterium]USO05983.1 MAG: hypothetical protein H6859_01900 [Rhodospirillales bacterium]HOO82720.1 hypothetical protein [Alphaproteobacteria bacterium]